MEVEVKTSPLTEFAQQNHSCNPATRPKPSERRHVSYPFFHPQCLAQCLTQRRHPTGAELNADALEQIPAEAGVTPFKEQQKGIPCPPSPPPSCKAFLLLSKSDDLVKQ